MNTNRLTNARVPGSVSGKGPRDYGTGRRCVCGAVILRYRKGDLCGLCERDPDRRARFANQEEDAMEPETMKTKEVATYLAIQQHTVKKVMRDAGISPVRRGGPGISATWPADAVRALKAKRDEAASRTFPEPSVEEAAERVVQDAAVRNGHPRPTEDDPELDVPRLGVRPSGFEAEVKEAAELEAVVTDQQAGCYSDGEECCGKPGDCELAPTDAGRDETQEEHVQRKLAEFATYLGEHLSFAARAGEAVKVYVESIELARRNGVEAYALEGQLRELGIEVQPPHMAPFPFLTPPSGERDPYHEDAEINALYVIAEALEPLDRAAQLRVLQWVTAKLGLDKPVPASDPDF